MHFDRKDVLTSSYATHGTWDGGNSPPQATVARQVVGSPLQRRSFTTDIWHGPPLPKTVLEEEAKRQQLELAEKERLQSIKLPFRYRQPMSLANIA